jgi:hypothetical protein
LRAVAKTLYPRALSPVAVTRPIPLEQPVTRIFLEGMGKVLNLSIVVLYRDLFCIVLSR